MSFIFPRGQWVNAFEPSDFSIFWNWRYVSVTLPFLLSLFMHYSGGCCSGNTKEFGWRRSCNGIRPQQNNIRSVLCWTFRICKYSRFFIHKVVVFTGFYSSLFPYDGLWACNIITCTTGYAWILGNDTMARYHGGHPTPLYLAPSFYFIYLFSFIIGHHFFEYHLVFLSHLNQWVPDYFAFQWWSLHMERISQLLALAVFYRDHRYLF